MKKLLSILMLLVAIVTGAMATPTVTSLCPENDLSPSQGIMTAFASTDPNIDGNVYAGRAGGGSAIYKASGVSKASSIVFKLKSSAKVYLTLYNNNGSNKVTTHNFYSINENVYQAVKLANEEAEGTRLSTTIAAWKNSADNTKSDLYNYIVSKFSGFKSANADSEKALLGVTVTEGFHAAYGKTDNTAISITSNKSDNKYFAFGDATTYTSVADVLESEAIELEAGCYLLVTSSTQDKVGIIAISTEAASLDPALSISPEEANAFTYVAGNGPSDAQEFTVTLKNSEKAVSATLTGDYEMSKTENGTYSSNAITDLANGSKVYVRLKAGLEKADDYNGTLTFANDDVTNDVVVNLSGSVTGQTYTVDYELNGGSGTASQDPAEAGDVITLAAAPTKDFTNFAGWFCSADDHVYEAGAAYTMTAANTTFTAQWTGTTYSSTLDFAAETIKRAVYKSSTAPTGEKAFTNINTFLESGNMIGTSGLSNSNWEPSDEKTGYIGYKLKATSASVKFMAESGKKVTITFGSIGADVTLKKNGVSSTISANSGDQKQTVVSFDANEDMLVEIVTSSTSNKTVTLNKIAIENAVASTVVKVGTTGFATIGLPYVSTVPADVTAYTVTPTTSSKVTLSPVDAGATIPAYKGLIIVAEPGNHTFTQKFTEGTSTYDTGTGLLATGAVTRNSAATEGEFYYFAIIDSTNKKVGFKKCAANATLAANKAYLPGALVPSGSNSLEISFDGETAINGIAESEANAEAPVKVIKNGKLFIGNYNVAGARIK